MANNSLNIIAWQKLQQNKLALFSLYFILGLCLISCFAVFISPDNSPHANEMHLELATQPPFTNIVFLEIPQSREMKLSSFESFFLGEKKTVKRIPLQSFIENTNSLSYYRYQSELLETYSGDYQIKDQTFWFGTDKYGRDVLSRIIYGLRVSLSVGFISVFISLIIGLSLGLIGGYFRGRIDDLVMWFVNVIWSIPTILMVIAITLALGKGFWQVFVAVGLTMWVEVARIVRGQVLIIRELQYIEAGKALVFSSCRIIFKHILPNVIGPVIVISAANFAGAILIEAGLSFLGLGAQPPIPSLGGMIRDHYSYIIMDKAYLAVIPGLVIMTLVLAFMLLANGLRDAFDVRH